MQKQFADRKVNGKFRFSHIICLTLFHFISAVFQNQRENPAKPLITGVAQDSPFLASSKSVNAAMMALSPDKGRAGKRRAMALGF